MSSPADTKRRLIAAASALFAERGLHATTVRDIAAAAGVNVAAANYHYGSKRDLYLAVLRDQFAAIRAELERRGASRPPEVLSSLGRDELAGLLQKRAQAMLDLLLGPPPGVHGTLMQREMLDPSEALPVIVEEFIHPMVVELEQIIGRLSPSLDAKQLRRCAFSIVGQAMFYRTAMPAILNLMQRESYPRGFNAPLAEHLTIFSLGGLESLEVRTASAPASSARRRSAKAAPRRQSSR